MKYLRGSAVYKNPGGDTVLLERVVTKPDFVYWKETMTDGRRRVRLATVRQLKKLGRTGKLFSITGRRLKA